MTALAVITVTGVSRLVTLFKSEIISFPAITLRPPSTWKIRNSTIQLPHLTISLKMKLITLSVRKRTSKNQTKTKSQSQELMVVIWWSKAQLLCASEIKVKYCLIRNGRPYDVTIIDEVDSMFIDEKANQTLLSTTFAGFHDLVLPMRILWQTIYMHNIVKEGEKLILFI